MSPPRFHVDLPLATDARVALPRASAHHAARVLRLQPGDPVTLFNGQGGEFTATIVAIGRDAVEVEVGAHQSVERESPLTVTLVQALSSGERMDLTIQKAVELGVSCIVPVESERSVVRLRGERADKRVTHWRQIVIAACEQCGRNRIPEVEAPVSLSTRLAGQEGDALRWILLPGAERTLREQPRPDRPIELLVGPEGGFAEAEVERVRAAGFLPLCLGPRVLRTETAAPALLAALQALWGDF